MMYLFANCALDHQTYRLYRDNQQISMPTKAFQLLVYLLEQRGRVVSKQELYEAVWQAQFVSDAAVENVMKRVRQAVGDSGRDQRIIKTLYSQGYRFIAPVELSGPPASPSATRLGLPPTLGETDRETQRQYTGLMGKVQHVDMTASRRRTMIGRDRELAILEALWAHVEVGRGQVVNVVGPPGIGKSRLIEQFRLRLNQQQQSRTYLQGRCLRLAVDRTIP